MNKANEQRWTGLLLLAVTTFGWGMNWAFIKVLLREWPPLFSRGVAGVAAAVILAGVARALGESLVVPRKAWSMLGLAAFTNVFAWMGFGTAAMVNLSIAEGTLLCYTMPIWAVLLAWPMQGTRPGLRDIAALLLGIAGIATLFAGQPPTFGSGKLSGIGFALAAAILFAFGSVRARAPMPLAPTALVAWQVGLGCAPMMVFGLLFEQPQVANLSPAGATVLIYMTLGPMALCYFTWFAALRRLPAATAAMSTLIVPLIGVVAAAIVLGEPLGLRELLAAVLTLSGVALAIRR